jgi:hypothetical protein
MEKRLVNPGRMSASASPSRRSSFIGEGDGENGGRGDVFGGDQVRDAMRNDARFSAAGAGQDQERTFS